MHQSFGVRLSEAYTVVPNMRSTIIVRLHEEAKSQAQGFIGVVILVGVSYNYSERCYCMMPPRHVYPKLCHLFFSKSVLEPVQQPHKLHVHITHLLVINSKGQMPVCHTSSSPIHVINLCMTSLHIFTALPFTITVLHLHVIDGLHVLLQVPVPGVLHGWHDP